MEAELLEAVKGSGLEWDVSRCRVLESYLHNPYLPESLKGAGMGMIPGVLH